MMPRISRFSGRWTASLVAAAAIVPAPQALAREPVVPVVTLGKSTVVMATSHSYALLKVSEDVSLREMRSFVSGGGRVAGYAFSNRGQGDREDDILVYSFTFNRCRKRGCPATEDPLSVRVASGVVNGVVPAGTYDLYVVADDAPVTVTFKSRYLRGKSRVRLEGNQLDVNVRTLPMSAATTSDGTVFSAGDFSSIDPGNGLGLLGLWALGSPYGGGAFGSCFYFDDTLAAAPDAAFLPGCPTGSSASRYPVLPTALDEGGVVYQSTYESLPLGIGGWATSAGAISSFGAVGLWLRF